MGVSVIIKYEGSTRQKFFDGDISDTPSKKNPRRERIGGKDKKNYPERANVTINTVMGILERSMGRNEPLHYLRTNNLCYFEGIRSKIKFKDYIETEREELITYNYSRKVDDPNGACGAGRLLETAFTSADDSKEFWDVLYYNEEEILNFITEGTRYEKDVKHSDSFDVCLRFAEMTGSIQHKNKDKLDDVVRILNSSFPEAIGGFKVDEFEAYDKVLKEKAKVIGINRKNIYCAALYLKAIDMESKGYDLSGLMSKKGCIKGVSKKGVTLKDIRLRYSTGGKKYVLLTPVRVTVVSGALVIYLDVSKEKALKIKTDVESCGVMNYRVGGKGTAYIKEIRIG